MLPVLTTATHDYIVLPADRWHLAMPLIIDLVGSSAMIPNPATSSLLAAVSLESGEIDGVMFTETVILADRFACRSGLGVSFSAMHRLIQLSLPAGTVYYAAVAESVAGVNAADRAGLESYASLRIGIGTAGIDDLVAAEMGGEAEDAVDVGSSGGRSNRQLPRG